MSEEVSRELSTSLHEWKEPMKREGSQLSRACWEDRLLDTDEAVVVSPKKGEVSEPGGCVANNAAYLECAWLSW